MRTFHSFLNESDNGWKRFSWVWIDWLEREKQSERLQILLPLLWFALIVIYRSNKKMPNNISFTNWRTDRSVTCWSRWIWLTTASRESDRKGHRKGLNHAHAQLFDRCGGSGRVQHRKSAIHGLPNLVPRAQVSFRQHQDTELWNNQFPES